MLHATLDVSSSDPVSVSSDEWGDLPAVSSKTSSLVSRNITIDGHRTSVRLEPKMWDGLREICYRERQTLHEVCTSVAQRKPPEASLTAAIRVFVMAYYRIAATEEGHLRVGHGPGGPFAPRVHHAVPPVVVNKAPEPVSSSNAGRLSHEGRQRGFDLFESDDLNRG